MMSSPELTKNVACCLRRESRAKASRLLAAARARCASVSSMDLPDGLRRSTAVRANRRSSRPNCSRHRLSGRRRAATPQGEPWKETWNTQSRQSHASHGIECHTAHVNPRRPRVTRSCNHLLRTAETVGRRASEAAPTPTRHDARALTREQRPHIAPNMRHVRLTALSHAIRKCRGPTRPHRKRVLGASRSRTPRCS